MTICERMFEIMDAKGISAYSLCKDLGLRNSTVSNWKKRKTDPPASCIVPICEVLGCSVEYLLTGSDASCGISTQEDAVRAGLSKSEERLSEERHSLSSIPSRLIFLLGSHLAGTSDLLRVLGISEDDAESISRIDRGILLAEEVVPICKYFGCTVKFLLTGEEEQRGSLFGVQLDKDSRTLLEIYDSLSDREQGILLGEAKGMLYSCEDKGDTGNPKSSAGKAV